MRRILLASALLLPLAANAQSLPNAGLSSSSPAAAGDVTAAGTPGSKAQATQGVPGGVPVPTADPGNASYLDAKLITPGTAFTAGRAFAFYCTTAGTITITLASGVTMTFGITPAADIQTKSFGITNLVLNSGAATFWNLP